MNQHSQISEKIFAFQRAVDLYSIATSSQPVTDLSEHLPMCPFTHAKDKRILKQDESYQCLVQMSRQLVDLLLANIDCNIEAVRLAVLKTIEYLLDVLGCSLDKSLLLILVTLIKTYPLSTSPASSPRQVCSFF